jgi:hypothetical protein
MAELIPAIHVVGPPILHDFVKRHGKIAANLPVS